MYYFGVFAFILICLNRAATTETTQGNCACAVFAVSLSNQPLMEHKFPLNVSCDEEGSEKCLALCTALAEGVKKQAPALICEKLNRHVENLKVSVHTRVCNMGDWKFTGLEMTQGICCHEGKDTECRPRPRK
ncbi:uncharacterized protein [Venturia canescens]|uniref:uncharacterized protein n=1 Tax=Venturia canescens TaxID=32260 RepID=UPI001C9D1A5D|nr:uncharacterized protein LOC122418162 [Venturia canescens]